MGCSSRWLGAVEVLLSWRTGSSFEWWLSCRWISITSMSSDTNTVRRSRAAVSRTAEKEEICVRNGNMQSKHQT